MNGSLNKIWESKQLCKNIVEARGMQYSHIKIINVLIKWRILVLLWLTKIRMLLTTNKSTKKSLKKRTFAENIFP